jgi:hypothetical protein
MNLHSLIKSQVVKEKVWKKFENTVSISMLSLASRDSRSSLEISPGGNKTNALDAVKKRVH